MGRIQLSHHLTDQDKAKISVADVGNTVVSQFIFTDMILGPALSRIIGNMIPAPAEQYENQGHCGYFRLIQQSEKLRRNF